MSWILSSDEFHLPALVRRKILSYCTLDEQIALLKKFSYFQVLDQNNQEKLNTWSDYGQQLELLQVVIKDAMIMGRMNRISLNPYNKPERDQELEAQLSGSFRPYFFENVSCLHYLDDYIQAGYLESNHNLETINLTCQQGISYRAGYRDSYLIPAKFISQFQIKGKNKQHLETIISRIRTIELDIGDIRIIRTYSDLLELEWYLMYKNKLADDVTELPILQEFCCPNRPHSMHLNHSAFLTIEWKTEFECFPPSVLMKKSQTNEAGQFPGQPPEFQVVCHNSVPRSLHSLGSIRYIMQWQFTGEESICRQDNKIRLFFNFPCTHFLICLKQYIEDNSERNNLISDGHYRFVDGIDYLGLELDGYTCFQQIPGWLFSQTIPEQLGLPTLPKRRDQTRDQVYYLISFNGRNPFDQTVHISEMDPNVNCSRFDRMTLSFRLKDDVFKNMKEPEFKLSTYALNHNLLVYRNHLAGIMFYN